MFEYGRRAQLAVRYPLGWNEAIEAVASELGVSKSQAIAKMINHSGAECKTISEWAEKLKPFRET